MEAQALATALVAEYASTLRVADRDYCDGWHVGVACAVETAVRTAYGFTTAEARQFIRVLIAEV